MKRIARIPAALLALIVAAWSCPTPAVGDTIVVYTSITSFEAALSSYDQFNEPQSTTLGPGAHGFGATVSGTNYKNDGVNASGNDAGYSPGAILSGGTLNFASFLNGANAFGGFFYNAGGSNTEVDSGSVTLTFNGGTTETVTTPSSDTVPFMGFIDMTGPLTTVTVGGETVNQALATADRVIIGAAPTAVPEPTSMLMTAGGLALAGLVAYRRGNAARA
jgi:hypothetical protein